MLLPLFLSASVAVTTTTATADDDGGSLQAPTVVATSIVMIMTIAF